MKKFMWIGGVVAILVIVLVVTNSIKKAYLKAARECLKGTGQPAISACIDAIKSSPDPDIKMGLLISRSDHYWKAGQIKEALTDSYAALELKGKANIDLPPDVLAQLYRSLVLLNSKAGNSAEALKFADLAIQNGSKEPLVYLTRATHFVAAEDYISALPDLNKAEELGLRLLSVYYGQGRAYMELKNYQKAYTCFKSAEALNTDPRYADSLSPELGLTCFALKRYEEAIPYLKRALAAGAPCVEECSAALAVSQKALRPPARPARRKR